MKSRRNLLPLAVMALLATTACERVESQPERPDTAQEFPLPDRPVSGLGANQFSTETQRDSVNEAQVVMDLANIRPGMTVADIGAGEGYYTVRLSERVGAEGRVLAQDIDRAALQRLGERVNRERLDNVSIALGAPDDPRLPKASFDRIFLVHMYHEVAEPYAFLWRLWPAVKPGGEIIVVDVDRPTDQHGIDPLLLQCEFRAVGFELVEFNETPQLAGYFAKFRPMRTRTPPRSIEPCRIVERPAADDDGDTTTGTR